MAAPQPLSSEEQHALTRDKASIARANELYLRAHPELGSLIGSLVRAMLEKRPTDPVAFAADYFASDGGGSGRLASAQPLDANGKSLAVGDRVEVRYKGEGARYFPGKISAITHHDGTVKFNIAYDDGDKEEGALPANVRFVRKEEAHRAGQDLSKSAKAVDAENRPVAVGDRVEARRYGRGTSYLRGRVCAIHPDRVTGGATFGIEYDDGEFEDRALSANVFVVSAPRSHGASGSTGGGSAPSSHPPPPADERQGKDADGKLLAVGDRVEVRYKGKGTRFFPGKVGAITHAPDGSATFSIAYDDGDKEEGALSRDVRHLPTPVDAGAQRRGSATAGPIDSTGAVLAVGDRVIARFRGRGAPGPATVIAIRGVRVPGGTGSTVIDLQFDDGGAVETGALPGLVQRTGPGGAVAQG